MWNESARYKLPVNHRLPKGLVFRVRIIVIAEKITDESKLLVVMFRICEHCLSQDFIWQSLKGLSISWRSFQPTKGLRTKLERVFFLISPTP